MVPLLPHQTHPTHPTRHFEYRYEYCYGYYPASVPSAAAAAAVVVAVVAVWCKLPSSVDTDSTAVNRLPCAPTEATAIIY